MSVIREQRETKSSTGKHMGGRMTKTSRGLESIAPGGSDDDVLTLAEAAEFTKVSERTLWQLAREGKVPHKRVGSQYRFLKNMLVEWMSN